MANPFQHKLVVATHWRHATRFEPIASNLFLRHNHVKSRPVSDVADFPSFLKGIDEDENWHSSPSFRGTRCEEANNEGSNRHNQGADS
jgi:hypothetical protein